MTGRAASFEPYREPLWVTVRRTVLIALVTGTAFVLIVSGVPDTTGEIRTWAAGCAGILWISFGGHWVEVLYLNAIRPGLAGRPAALVPARLAVWWSGGTALIPAALTTAMLLGTSTWPATRSLALAALLGGPLFILVECVVHVVMLLTGRPSFWNARG